MTGELRPSPAAGAPEPPAQPPGESPGPAAKGTGEAGCTVSEPGEAPPQQARGTAARAPHPGTQPPSSSPWWPARGGSQRAPPGKGPAQARVRRGGRGRGSPQPLYRLSLAGSRARPPQDEPPQAELPQGARPGTHGPPSLPRTGAPPAPDELGFQRCFQESCSGFTSSNYTSPSPGPRPAPRDPRPGGASPSPPAYPEFPGSEAGTWPPAAEDSFPGANFGAQPAEPVPFLESGSPSAAPFQYPFPALPGDAAQPKFADGTVVLAFHQTPGPWRAQPGAPRPAFPLPPQPAPPPLPGYPGPVDAPSDLRGALSTPGAAPPVPSPFPASLHKSLTQAHPKRSPSAQDGVVSLRGPPGALPQVHFMGKTFGRPGAGGLGTSPGPLDKELATAGPPPTPQPQLWGGGSEALSLMGSAAATYPTPGLAPLAAPRSALFDSQPSPGQQLCLPQSPPLPWSQVVPTAGPSPTQLDLLSQLPFPTGGPEWQGGGQGALGGPSPLPGPGDDLTGPGGGPGRPDSSSPALFAFHGLKDAAAQPLFFGVAQPQVSPRLPPPRVVGASPSESPLPSPATNTAGSSSCSSLSPLSSSPANPSSEESQLPTTFLHHAARPQEASTTFPAPEPLHALPLGYQPGLPEPFPFPAEGPFKCLGEAAELGRGGLGAFPRGPPPYPTHHFTLSSASLDQLDVLLTCRQCDQNYSNLAGFLQHRQFCSLLLAKAKDGPPGLPAAAPAPKAPAAPHPSLLSPARPAGFLLDGDTRGEGKDDLLRTGFFPGLAAVPLPLPTSELDMEDAAKLDSLITEALNGLEYQVDSPEIDSSFIDVFADEEPSGPRGPGAGPPPKARPGAAADGKAPPPAPAPTPEPRAPRLGDQGPPPPSRPPTQPRGPAPPKAGPGTLGQPRRGKRLKWFRAGPDPATAKGPGRGTRTCPRPRKRGNRPEPPPSHPRDLRAPKGRAEAGLHVQTRRSRRVRLPAGKDTAKRPARGGTWSKELIQKIVQQKNKLCRRRRSLAPEMAAPSAQDGGFPACNSASEDEGPRQSGSSLKGRPCHGYRRRRRGDRRSAVAAAQGPGEVQGQQRLEKGRGKQDAGPDSGSLTPGPGNGHSQSPTPQPATADRTPPEAPEPLLCASPGTQAALEQPPLPAASQDSASPGMAEERPSDPTGPGPPRPGENDTSNLLPPGALADMPPRAALPGPGPGASLGAPRGPKPLAPPDRGDGPTGQRGELPVLAPNIADATSAEPGVPFWKNHSRRGSVGVPGAEEEPPSCRSSPGPGDLAGRRRDPPDSGLLDTPPVGSLCVCPDSVGTKSPKGPLSSAAGDPDTAASPLTLKSTALFGGRPVDGFDPLLYDGRDCHAPSACADLPTTKTPWDVLRPQRSLEKDWLGLGAGSLVLPDPLGPDPGRLGCRPLGRQPQGTGTVASRLAPGKASTSGGVFTHCVSESELEIKRLVTELESQLQKGAPGALPKAEHAVGANSDRGWRPPSLLPARRTPVPSERRFMAAELTALSNLDPFQGGEGMAGGTPEGWHRPASFHLGEVAPRAPCSPPAARHHFRTVLQKDPVSKMESTAAAEHRARLDVCLSDPLEQRKPPLDAKSSPSCAPRFPARHEAPGTCPGESLPLCLPRTRTGGLGREPPTREVPSSPAAHRTPGLVFQRDETVSPDARSREACQEDPKSNTGTPEGPGPPWPTEEGPSLGGSEGREVVSTPLPSPASVPNVGLAQDPAMSPLRHLQLLVARAAESEDDTPVNSPGPPDPAASVLARRPRGPGAHVDILHQAESEEHKGGGQASQLQAGKHGSPGQLGSLAARSAKPETLPAGPVGGTDWLGEGFEGSGVAWGLQHKAQAAPNGSSSALALAAAPAPHGPVDWTLEKAAGLGLTKWPLSAGETLGPPDRDLALVTFLPAREATPAPLQQLPQEDPPTVLSGALGACSELGGLCPASPHFRDPPSPHGPTWTPLQAPTEAGLEQPAAAPPPLSSHPCDPREGVACYPPLDSQGLGALSPTCGMGCAESRVFRTLEGSRKERQQGSPTHSAPSPTVPVKAMGLPSVPGTDGSEVGRCGLRSDPKLQVPDPHGRGALDPPSPGSPRPTARLGPREGHHTVAVSEDPSAGCTLGTGALACLAGEKGASGEGQEEPWTPRAGHSGVRVAPRGSRGPTASGPAVALLDEASRPGSVAGDSGPDSPQGEPPSAQDAGQLPRGPEKKLTSSGTGCGKDGAPAGPFAACEICASSFRSQPGLNRHGARKPPPREEGQVARPCRGALQHSAKPARAPGKRGREVPGKETPCNLPGQGSATPGDMQGPETSEEGGQGPSPLGTPESPCSPYLTPPELTHQGQVMQPAASRSRRVDGPSKARPCPRGTRRRGAGLRQRPGPGEPPGHSKGRSSKKGRKPRAGSERKGPSEVETSPPPAPEGISQGPSTHPAASPSAPLHLGPSPRGECRIDERPPTLAAVRGTGVTAGPEEVGLGVSCVEQTRPRGPPGGSHGERTDGAPARASPGARGTSVLGTCKKPWQVTGHTAAEGSSGGESRTREGILEGHENPWGTPGCPETLGAEVSGSPRNQAQGHPGRSPEALSPGPGDAMCVLDDEAAFSLLFPLGDRRTRRKPPRVYGKRGPRPKPPVSPPSSAASRPLSPRLPMDLSDSGSLCLSHEGPWDDETFLLNGLLSNHVPAVDTWTPSPGPRAPEPDRALDSTGTAPPHCADATQPPHLRPDSFSERIPELHMVPAAWRGLELRAPPDEVGSSCREASPEPPDLERERYEAVPPGTTSSPLLPALDYEGLSARFQMQDPGPPGPGEGPGELPGASCLGFESAAGSQGPQSARTEEAGEAGRAPGSGSPAKARGGCYKCRVCFQRFHGLAELDLHKLTHSPSPPPTCYMCVERRFGSRQLLREHLREKHAQGRTGPWACGMCLKEVADVWMYNEHLREHAVRFARRGQARVSLQGQPGCGEEGSAVSCLLGSCAGHAAQPHAGSTGRASGRPWEAPAQETGAGRGTPKQRVRPRARAPTAGQSGSWTPDSPCTRAASSSAAASPGLSPEPGPDGQAPVQSGPVHQACQDPSRHCHHCGKRFPKPFKLQRHLVVHSPQRVYLCPRCPHIYGEPGELQGHLSREHGAREEPEPPPTPLFACELCAVVMHVIKRSFVCSTCNYTFAKKEQFDRHMDKHRRGGLQPFAFRRVWRPGQRTPAREGALPSKRRKVAASGSPPGPSVDRPLSPSGSPALPELALPALLPPGPEACAAGEQAETQEEPADPAGRTSRVGDPPREADLRKLLPPTLSPFPAVADGKGGLKPDPALEGSEDKASLDSPMPLPPPQPEATSSPDVEGKAAGLSSGKCRSVGAPGRCAPDHCPPGPSSVQKEKPGPTCPMRPGAVPGGTSHKDRTAVSMPGKVPKFPPQLRRAVASPRELARDAEDKLKPSPPKAKPGPSAKAEGGSLPQPTSGQLQSETASTPAKPHCPGQSPTPNKPLPQAPAKGCTRGPQGSLGPRESSEGSEKKRRGRTPGPTRSEGAGALGRAPSEPDKPPRNPRKQATPSRVLPTKPRPSSQISKTLLQSSPTPGDFWHRREGLGKAFPELRPLHRPSKRGRAAHGAEPTDPHAHRTAESQSDLLNQLFGQRLTSFKIPLKKDAAE
ncbi:zinc finger protein 469 [Tamandua tetradactyla]|uniref:zinc finger protein 469 n=1 Tax=Tamandua tetradactyla TaxID=48850 RepID=UPI00405386EF